MLSNLLCRQARLVLLPRVSSTLGRYPKRVAVATTQRTFSLSCVRFQEEPLSAPDRPNPSEDYQQISVEPTTPPLNTRTLWLANLHYRTRAEEVYELFSPYGTIKAVHFPRNNDGLRSGRAYVEFSTPSEATRVFESAQEEPFVLKERLVRIEFAKNPPKAWIANHNEIRPNSILHIANYPFPGDQGPLLALMHNFNNEILKIHFMKDAHGEPTRKAFITFRNLGAAQKALLNFQGHEMGGTKLLLFFAHHRDKSSHPRPRGPRSEPTPTAYDA